MAAPSSPPEYAFGWAPSPTVGAASQPNRPDEFSPPLIAIVAVVGTAFLIIFYVRLLSRHLRRYRRCWRRWRRRRRLALSTELGSPGPGAAAFDYFSSGGSSNFFHSPYGLDDSAIKTLPLSLFSKAKGKHVYRDCAVCLFEFEDSDSVRTLPLCAHAFHVDCIDIWLRSHASCPLCRAGIFRQDSPFVPMRAARIRPSLDDVLFAAPAVPSPMTPAERDNPASEMAPEAESPAMIHEESQIERRDFLLKRSYSFGFERNLAADRMAMEEASTASPWRYRHRGFWSKRWPSPFGSFGGGMGVGGGSSSSRAARVFSFRVTVKSPFVRRRGFFPLSESSARLGGGMGPSSRRTRSLTSPIVVFWNRPAGAAGFGSSRQRCGDPEALLSPERLNRR